MSEPVLIRPGDTLVVSVAHALDEAEVTRLRQQWREALPDVHLVLVENVSGLAVFCRAEGD